MKRLNDIEWIELSNGTQILIKDFILNIFFGFLLVALVSILVLSNL